MEITAATERMRDALAQRRGHLDEVLRRYGARNPRLFGSVARGDASSTSDLDLLVDLDADGGNELLRVAGISEELSDMLGFTVDVVTPSLLRDGVSRTASADAVSL